MALLFLALIASAGALHRSQGPTDDQPTSGIDDPADKEKKEKEEWVRPFSLTNGACEHIETAEAADRYVMNIKQVGAGSYYIGEIGFGTPEQKLNMLLDTGSDEIVIKSSNCRGCKGRGYNHNESSTYVEETLGPDNGVVSMSYGSGDVIGQRGFDTVHTGPLSGEHMPIVRVQESNIDMFEDTEETALEVVLGMAPGLREYVGERLASSMKVRRFTQCLPDNANEDGMFVINDKKPDGSQYQGPFNSVGSYYWAVGIQNFRLEWTMGENAKTKKPRALGKPFVMIIDTGTTLLSLPRSIMNNLSEELEDIGYDCSNMHLLPELMFDIDGVNHVLPPKAYIAASEDSFLALNSLSSGVHTAEEKAKMAAVTSQLYFKKPFLNLKTGAQCMLLFTEPLDMDSPEGELGILGMAFFREYAIHFDFCSRQMWTARSYGDCSGNVGQHPDNVNYCEDKSWFSCFGQGVKDFFTYIGDGIKSIFGGKKEEKKAKFTMAGERKGPLLTLNHKKIRQSEAAKWLLSTKTEGGMVEI